MDMTWNRPVSPGVADAPSCQKQPPQVRTPHEQTALERQIAAKGRQIDALAYELYGLTEEEIAIDLPPAISLGLYPLLQKYA